MNVRRGASAPAFINGDREMLRSALLPRRAILSARRVVLLTTVAGLGATALFASADVSNRGNPFAFGAAIAETAQRPVGFGDLVEKVRPAVISVHVK